MSKWSATLYFPGKERIHLLASANKSIQRRHEDVTQQLFILQLDWLGIVESYSTTQLSWLCCLNYESPYCEAGIIRLPYIWPWCINFGSYRFKTLREPSLSLTNFKLGPWNIIIKSLRNKFVVNHGDDQYLQQSGITDDGKIFVTFFPGEVSSSIANLLHSDL